MAASSPDQPVGKIAQALTAFSLHDSFPEEEVSSLEVSPEVLPAAIHALAEAKAKLEAEIHNINEETASDVSSWRASGKSVQDDIIRSKALASEIIKQADAPTISGKATENLERKADFLVRELNYNQQVQDALRDIKGVNQTLDQAEQACNERRILDALHLLEKAWAQLDIIPVSKSCRVIKLLDIRAFELKSDVHDVFDHVWNTLVHVDRERGCLSVYGTREDEPMSLSDAVIGLKAYKEVDQRVMQLWQDIDQAIISPRMDITNGCPPAIRVQDNLLETNGAADKTVRSLFRDLEQIFRYMLERLPPDMVESISSIMMPAVVSKITTVWLDSAVPYSLKDMDEFQEVITVTKEFCVSLSSLGLSGFGELQEWVDSAPRVWLSKCREAALDSVRSKLAQGLGESKQVEKVERQMVSTEEGKQLTAKGGIADADDHGWDVSWDDDEPRTAGGAISDPAPETDELPGEDDGADAWGWGEDEAEAEAGEKPEEAPAAKAEKGEKVEEEDPSEAWGWGEEEQAPASEEEPKPPTQPSTQEPRTKELILKETYNISSMPEPVLALIFAILDDGAALTGSGYENSPVTAAATGLFSLPTLALAMFRAVSPHYYALDIGGNMYLYNDASYLAERLADFASNWKSREDLSSKAKSMVRLDNDVKALQNFANRAYSNEMNTQKLVLRDLLGGAQNLLHQEEAESCVDSAVARVQSMAVTWESILARSVWYQATGSLVDTVSTKIIADVLDLPSIGQDEAYNIAKLIATVTELDYLFLPSRVQSRPQGTGSKDASEIPLTAQYAPSWLRLQYLSEVLQSNLRDVRYLWMESELSLYFSAEEVVDLINQSFEDNARTREVIREIKQNPEPRKEEGQDNW